MLDDKIIGCIKGSLFNLNTQEIPNFWRSSSIWMEQFANESLQLYSIEANRPAFSLEDGSIYIEPDGVNLVTHCFDLGNAAWIKGSNVFVLPDKAAMAGISGSELHLGDRVVWAAGSENSQKIQRTLYLPSAKDHYLSLILRLSGGVAGKKDVIRIAGRQINLDQLNQFSNRVRILESAFKVPGPSPAVPPPSHDKNEVTALSSLGVTISIYDSIGADRLIGGRVQFGTSPKFYGITANTASINNSLNLTLDASPATDGVSVGTSIYLQPPALVPVELEFYVESSITLDVLGIQVEPRKFRTSFIFQDDEIFSRSSSKLIFRKNPIANLKTFGILFSLKEWRGDGNLFRIGNLNASISFGALVVSIGEAKIQVPSFPKAAAFFLQVSQENNNGVLYVDGVQRGSVNLVEFTSDRHAAFDLTSEGVRVISDIVFFDKLLQAQDIAKLFDGSVLIGATLISTGIPLIPLPALRVPSKSPPVAKTQIIDVGATNVTVTNQSGFVANSLATVLRDGSQVMRVRLGSLLNNNVIQMDTTNGILPGDFLVFGNVDIPGQASSRFPYIASEELPIIDLDPGNKTLRVSSTLSFRKGRAFIRSNHYEEINEIKILNKDDGRLLLYVDDVTDIRVGHVVSQPAEGESEMIVHPDNYDALLLNPVNGISISCYNNGLVLTNSLDVDVEVQPCIRVAY